MKKIKPSRKDFQRFAIFILYSDVSVMNKNFRFSFVLYWPHIHWRCISTFTERLPLSYTYTAPVVAGYVRPTSRLPLDTGHHVYGQRRALAGREQPEPAGLWRHNADEVQHGRTDDVAVQPLQENGSDGAPVWGTYESVWGCIWGALE